ncbi:MAG: hypothetical protein L6R37_004412 [Teloschistes peruensis]|nr:MAG: hypothetical protein L6R37_004412 [Teloschistes peruensis]
MTEPTKLLSAEEVSKHNTAEDLWIVVDGQVWDMTDFAPEHPGGIGSKMENPLSSLFRSLSLSTPNSHQTDSNLPWAKKKVILQHAGHDASKPYNEIHSPSLLTATLPASKRLGALSPSSSSLPRSPTPSQTATKPAPTKNPTLQLAHRKPPLTTLISAHDFKTVASKTLAPKTWAFYSSAATDLVTHAANSSVFERMWWRPRVLRDVRVRDTRSRLMGLGVEMPVFVSPAAMARLVHPEGERAIARAVGGRGVVQCVSTNASYSITDIVSALPSPSSATPKQPPPIFFQLYVSKNRVASESLLRTVHDLGITTVFLTVDSPLAGKREADERVRMEENQPAPMMTGSKDKPVNDKQGGGLGRITGSFIDASLSWADLPWLRRHWKGKIVLKGIMCAADARRAAQEGVDGILLSNHGGRNLDTAPPAILILLDLQRNAPEVFEKMEVYVDGGIRRGTDILKALCLGATAVGVGRPVLYALGYGQEGVEHLFDILKDELSIAMALVGITDLSQAHPGLVNTNDVDHLIPTTEGHPYATGRRKGNPGPRSKL